MQTCLCVNADQSAGHKKVEHSDTCFKYGSVECSWSLQHRAHYHPHHSWHLTFVPYTLNAFLLFARILRLAKSSPSRILPPYDKKLPIGPGEGFLHQACQVSLVGFVCPFQVDCRSIRTSWSNFPWTATYHLWNIYKVPGETWIHWHHPFVAMHPVAKWYKPMSHTVEKPANFSSVASGHMWTQCFHEWQQRLLLVLTVCTALHHCQHSLPSQPTGQKVLQVHFSTSEEHNAIQSHRQFIRWSRRLMDRETETLEWKFSQMAT